MTHKKVVQALILWKQIHIEGHSPKQFICVLYKNANVKNSNIENPFRISRLDKRVEYIALDLEI